MLWHFRISSKAYQWRVWESLTMLASPEETAMLMNIRKNPGYLSHLFSELCVLPVPPNGLVVYCGTIVTDEGKEKKVNIDFEPFKPINTSLYLCDNKFHTEVRAFPLLIVFAHDFFLNITFRSHSHLFFLKLSPNRHWQPCSPMTVNLALLWSMVVGHCLAHCRATPERWCTSSLWTYPRSTVLTFNTLKTPTFLYF